MADQTTTKTNQTKVLKKPFDIKKWLPKIIWSFCLLMLLFSVFRIPYIGQLFDSTIFSFLFGYSKYILYIYLLIVCGFKLFNFKIKAIYQKRFILLILVATTLVSVCLGGLELMVHPGHPNLISSYINEIWANQIWNFDNHFFFGTPTFIDGGLIGTLFASIAGVFIMIFSLVILAIAYFSVFKNQWTYIKTKSSKLFHKIKKSEKIETTNTSNKSEKDNPSDKSDKLYLETLLQPKKQISLNLDENVASTINIDHEANLFSNFLQDNDISFARVEKNEDENAYCLVVKNSVDQLTRIRDLKDSFKLIGLSPDYHLITTDEMVKIEYPKNKPVLNHVLKKFLSTKIHDPLEFVLAVSENHKPIILNFKRDHLFGVFDPKHQNINNFINVLITSISTHYDKKNINITYLNPVSDKKNLFNTDLCHHQQVLGTSAIKTYLNEFEQSVNNLKQAIKENNVTNIYELNDLHNKIYKNNILIIDYIDFIKTNDKTLYEQIQNLVDHDDDYGIAMFCIDHSNEGITNAELNYQVVLGFAMDSKLSKTLFNSSAAASLDKQSQAILCKPLQQLKMKVIVPNISSVEFITLTNRFAKIAK